MRLLNTLGANVQKIYVDTLIAIGQDGNLYKEDLGKRETVRRSSLHWNNTAET